MIAFGPFLIAEHQRVAVWETLFIWFGDAVALFWFAVYFIRHFVFGIPIAERRGPSVRVDILWRIALVSIIGSLAVDLSYTLLIHESEREAFATANQTTGNLEVLRTVDMGINQRVYQVKVSFRDVKQAPRSFKRIVREPSDLDQLPQAVVQAIRGRRPVTVAVAYQAVRPKRAWLADLGWERVDSLRNFSLCVLLFQGLYSALFLQKMAQARCQTGALPWWYDLYGVVLLEIEAVYRLVFGGLVLLFDFPEFWA